MAHRNRILLGLTALACWQSPLHAEEEMAMMMGADKKLDPKQIEFFEKKVQPILKEIATSVTASNRIR